MAGEQLELDLDPKRVVQSLDDMGEAATKLADRIEESLGKASVKSIEKLQDAADKGTTRISTFFRTLGTRVKEDLKTAFDATGVLAGAKFAKDIGEGARQVFEMERAFDRLNTRLRLGNKELSDFKRELGRKAAGTGQELSTLLPGVESAASKGGVKSAGQLANIGEALGQAKATTGEETGGLSDTIVEILKNQGKAVTDKSFRETLDALQATRVSGAFGTAAQAGSAIEGLSPYAKNLGLGTRELGGLAATASRSGSAGQDILRQLLEKGTTVGGQQQLNSVLGQNIFKNGKLDASAIGKVNTGKYGQYSQQILEQATGLSGANGGDLKRFVEAFKGGMGDFNTVVKGTNETADQFKTATDNLASGVDRFKEHVKESGREIAEQLSRFANDMIKGDLGGAWQHGKGTLSALHENKGTLAAAGLLTAGVGVFAGGGLKNLLKKTGAGGLAGGLAKGELAKAAGVEPVYVTNAGEIASKSGDSLSDALGKGEQLATAAGKMGKFGRVMGAAGTAAKGLLAAGAAWEAGQAIGEALVQMPAVNRAMDTLADFAAKAIHGSDADALAQGEKQGMSGYLGSKAHKDALAAGHGLSPEALEAAVRKGTVAAHQEIGQPKTYSNPSAYPPQGSSM